MSMHKTILIGNLGSDPEMRYLDSGAAVTSFSVAVNERWTNRSSGEPQERTVWYRVSCWDRLAESCNQYLEKGRQVFVEGRLQEPRIYEGSDGHVRSAGLEMTAFDVRFLGGPNGQSNGAGYRDQRQAAVGAGQPANYNQQQGGYNNQPQQQRQQSGYDNQPQQQRQQSGYDNQPQQRQQGGYNNQRQQPSQPTQYGGPPPPPGDDLPW